jgi:hypothetical protein
VDLRYLAFGEELTNVWWVQTSMDPPAWWLETLVDTFINWDSVIQAANRSEDSVLTSIRALGRGVRRNAMVVRTGIGQYGTIRNFFSKMFPLPVAPVVRGLSLEGRRLNRVYLAGCAFAVVDEHFVSDDLTIVPEITAEALETSVTDLKDLVTSLDGYPHPRPVYVVAPRLRWDSSLMGHRTTTTRVDAYHCDRHYMGTQVRRGHTRDQH